jgi:ribonuclease HII
MKTKPSINRLEYERRCLQAGWTCIAGVDEAGRGPLAGPVTAAAVVLPQQWLIHGMPPGLEGLNDSKQLSTAQRFDYYQALLAEPEVRYAIVDCSAELIDQINILQATHRAMRQALSQLAAPSPHHVLVDGLSVPHLGFPSTPIVQGDCLSYSIAAASVLAKVYRDQCMTEYDHAFPGYGFARNKGYGTPEHLAALAKLGPCPIHRSSFAPVRLYQGDLFQ